MAQHHPLTDKDANVERGEKQQRLETGSLCGLLDDTQSSVHRIVELRCFDRRREFSLDAALLARLRCQARRHRQT